MTKPTKQTMTSIDAILEDVVFRDWRFFVELSVNGFLMQVAFRAFDVLTGDVTPQKGRKWYISQHATKSEIVQTAFKAVLTALEHEAREDFCYRGQPIFGPHFDVDDIAHRLPSTDVRTPKQTVETGSKDQ